ncbi:MAG: CbtB domain-containing protein [Casimicrobiaceae bacterium]
MTSSSPASADNAPAAERVGSPAVSHIAAPLCAALLGLLLLYAAGFAQTEVIHNGAHDARHAAGFACH